MIHVFVEMYEKYFFKGNAAETLCFGKTEIVLVDYANLFRSGQIAY